MWINKKESFKKNKNSKKDQEIVYNLKHKVQFINFNKRNMILCSVFLTSK